MALRSEEKLRVAAAALLFEEEVLRASESLIGAGAAQVEQLLYDCDTRLRELREKQSALDTLCGRQRALNMLMRSFFRRADQFLQEVRPRVRSEASVAYLTAFREHWAAVHARLRDLEPRHYVPTPEPRVPMASADDGRGEELRRRRAVRTELSARSDAELDEAVERTVVGWRGSGLESMRSELEQRTDEVRRRFSNWSYASKLRRILEEIEMDGESVVRRLEEANKEVDELSRTSWELLAICLCDAKRVAKKVPWLGEALSALSDGLLLSEAGSGGSLRSGGRPELISIPRFPLSAVEDVGREFVEVAQRKEADLAERLREAMWVEEVLGGGYQPAPPDR